MAENSSRCPLVELKNLLNEMREEVGEQKTKRKIKKKKLPMKEQ
jgi:hypothetical protein